MCPQKRSLAPVLGLEVSEADKLRQLGLACHVRGKMTAFVPRDYKISRAATAPVDVAQQLRLMLLHVRVLVPEHGLAVDPRNDDPLSATPSEKEWRD